MSSREKLGTRGILFIELAGSHGCIEWDAECIQYSSTLFCYRRERYDCISFSRYYSLWPVDESQLIHDHSARDFFPIRGIFFHTRRLKARKRRQNE